MGNLDDFPTQNPAQPIQDAAEAAFEAALQASGLFLYQQKDRRDYGSDYQLELLDGKARTNIRIHVQLKGTTEAARADGSTSITVARRNLNYLLVPSDSIYVCHRSSDGALLVRSAEATFSHYENSGRTWTDQETVTIRFTEIFDERYQRRLHAIALARGRAVRDNRLDWVATPPERLSAAVVTAVPLITVPTSIEAASLLLRELYERGHDAHISQSFEQFRAVIGDVPYSTDLLFMSEINLGLNGLAFSSERVNDALEYFSTRDGVNPRLTPASIAYTIGNALLALKRYGDAADSFRIANSKLDQDSQVIGARCWKNLGSALECTGDWEGARKAFETAVALDPDLAEAHMALGLWHRNRSKDLEQSIKHLDLVAKAPGSALSMRAVHAWRAAARFALGRTDDAFADIQSVVGGDHFDGWEWFWCGRLVAQYGKSTPRGTTKSLDFWRRFLKVHPTDVRALAESLTCEWLIHNRDGEAPLPFSAFKEHALSLMALPHVDAAPVWDRVGHWAQTDGDWSGAESAFRHAFELKPDDYAYCLGVALNHLGRWDDALTVLSPVGSVPRADSSIWFQIAFAQERIGNAQGAADGYRRAIDIEPDYALAHFNLGGVLWNDGKSEDAILAWREAIRRFPEHKLAGKLRDDFPEVFDTRPADLG